MSTRKKEGAPPGKEKKRGTSPSNAAGGIRRSPSTPKTDSGRSIPSYLKPTAASSSLATDSSKLQSGKKKPSSTNDKATIERRRSFDKPPSPSRSTRSPVPLNATLRSSSFNDPGANLARRRSFDKPPSPSRTTRSPSSSSSGKTSAITLNKGVSERNSKGPKDAGKQHTLYARPAVKKNTSVLSKKSEPSSRKKRVESSPPESEPEPPQSDDRESLAVEEEEPEYSLLGDQDVTNIIEQIEGESHENDAVIESPTVVEEHDASIESPENQEDQIVSDEHCTDSKHEDEDEVEDKSQDEETSNQEEEIKEETADENNDESGAGDPSEEVVEHKERDDDDEKNEEEVKVDNGSEANDEVEEKEVDVEEKKEEEEEDATPKVAHGKKDIALSNDVIEETRNKLIGQRKNKVKALAGAFETVISLQDK